MPDSPNNQNSTAPATADAIPDAIYFKASGEASKLRPKGKIFTYEELRALVGGMVEIVPLPSGDYMICNEEGKILGLPRNEAATNVWKHSYPISKYPYNNDELVVGDAIFTPSKFIM